MKDKIERKIGESEDEKRLREITEPLLGWYRENRRILPWREESSPYRVWISEIMLQQTRVEAGKAYFERFTRELPHVEALANVSDEQLMKLWEGLGYYNRARNLKKAAGVVMEQYGGALPGSYEELLKLPGIGPYTAGAISSIAFGLSEPAVDGNVLRVLSRVLLRREDIGSPAVRKTMEQELRRIMPQDSPGDFNQGIMELGALICIPNGAPRCAECPLQRRGLCRAEAAGVAGELPVKAAPKKRRIEERTVVILLDDRRQLGLRRRKEKGLLPGLWELPSLEGYLSAAEVRRWLEQQEGLEIRELREVEAAKHVFSHVEWHMRGFFVRVAGGEEFAGTVSEEKAVYAKDAESRKAAEAKQGLEKILFVKEAQLREKYAVPSAFKGFQKYFPIG